jgi:hypothetical protein
MTENQARVRAICRYFRHKRAMHSGALCCIVKAIASARPDRNAGMRRSRVTARSKRTSDTSSPQLAPPIGDNYFERSAVEAIRNRRAPAARRRKSIETDQVLTTADVVNITRKHRTTLSRWIKRDSFPPKGHSQRTSCGMVEVGYIWLPQWFERCERTRSGHKVSSVAALFFCSNACYLDGTGDRRAHIG